eukprot:augustus_masked-scaffold_24-processed-gene-2.11-mRNA-1 protein AED:0.41 eAED:0.44 QI:0/-1/0/1/-1/1/1/0/466
MSKRTVNRLEKPWIKIKFLGACGSSGRSCFHGSFGSNHILLDCGISLKGGTFQTRFPDFGQFELKKLQHVFITHAHLDHVGALPYLTERYGYKGKIYMTKATRDLSEVLLLDYIRVTRMNFKHNKEIEEYINYSKSEVFSCLKKVCLIELKEVLSLGKGKNNFEAEFIPAGHIIGAAMIRLTHNSPKKTMLYTGDFSTSKEHGLSRAKLEFISQFRPLDLLISESTYCYTIRESKIIGEGILLRKVVETLFHGNVLIPISANGRLQELLILFFVFLRKRDILDLVRLVVVGGLHKIVCQVWKNNASAVCRDVDFSFNDVVKKVEFWDFGNLENENRIQELEGYKNVILFSADGSLEYGGARKMFEIVKHDENSLVILPGHPVKGSLGDRLKEKKEKGVKCNFEVLNQFSLHTDAKGLMDLIVSSEAKVTCFVHGDEKNLPEFSAFVEKNSETKIVIPKLNQEIGFA